MQIIFKTINIVRLFISWLPHLKDVDFFLFKNYNLNYGYNNLYKGYFYIFFMVDIITFLKENPNSRKIFGKGELKIIEKQLQGVNLTQSEKNRLSRDIRKKLEIIKQLNKFEDEFYLKKGSIIKRIIQDTIEEILNDKLRKEIKEIWLFGSVVENKLTFRSDIDIGVIFKKKLSKKEAFKFRIRIAGRVSDKVDIQVFEFLPEKIQKSILKNHKVIYKNG